MKTFNSWEHLLASDLGRGINRSMKEINNLQNEHRSQDVNGPQQRLVFYIAQVASGSTIVIRSTNKFVKLRDIEAGIQKI